MAAEREPLLRLDPEELDLIDDEEDVEKVASNDEWAYKQADRLVAGGHRHTGEKDRRTEGEVFDHKTLMALHKLLVSGALRSLDFPLSTGKEANVFRGTTPQGGRVAVKIFRVNTATFKHVLKYIQGDERFAGVSGDKRDLVHAWTQKEYRNLMRMHEAGVDVPEPIRFLNNILIMEYLGTEEGPWPTLKDMGRLEDPERFWEPLHDDFVRIVNHAGLVHADLSEFNILVQDADDPKSARPRIIDVGQAVLRNHPMAHEFLARDAKNLTAYFHRQGFKVTAQDLLTEVSAP